MYVILFKGLWYYRAGSNFSSGGQRPGRETFTFLFRDAWLSPEPHQSSGEPCVFHSALNIWGVLKWPIVCGCAFFMERKRDRDEWIRFRSRLYGGYIELQRVLQLCMGSQWGEIRSLLPVCTIQYFSTVTAPTFKTLIYYLFHWYLKETTFEKC